jgi:hypothetical protein
MLAANGLGVTRGLVWVGTVVSNRSMMIKILERSAR